MNLTKTFANLLSITLFVTSPLALAGEISGSVQVSKSLLKKITPSAVLFIIARPEGQAGGPPAAVKRITQPFKFPTHFTLGAADSMMGGGGEFAGKFSLSARISQGGSAMPVSGDFQSKKPITADTQGKGVSILIDEIHP